MTGGLTALAAIVAFAALAGWAVPAVGMRMLWPAVSEGAPKVRNYRGADVAVGLGAVWLLWAVAVAAVTPLAMYALPLLAGDGAAADVGTLLGRAVSDPAWALVVGAFAFGLVDDLFGDADARGFKGHLAALRRGRLTTGGLKLLGVGSLSAVYAAGLTAGRAAGSWVGTTEAWPTLGTWVLATLVIALTANLVNLLDLRPGRALKGYSLLAVAGCATVGVRAMQWASGPTARGVPAVGFGIVAAVAVGLAMLGPVAAVWRLDAREEGMLGDAGANAMGALAGYVLAASLPFAGLAAVATVLAALNLVSERISFSRVIEGNAALSWIDRLGRRDEMAMTGPRGGARAGRTGRARDGNRKDGGS